MILAKVGGYWVRARFGAYFFGQVATFMYLTESMSHAERFNVDFWPQFSAFNLVVSNFWPLYWLGYFMDRTKLDEAYWGFYEGAQVYVTEAYQLFQGLAG